MRRTSCRYKKQRCYSLRRSRGNRGVSVFDKEFDKLFYYDGTDLGLTYQPEESTFRLWAPTASEAYILLYPDWQSAEARRFAMTRDVKGTWLLKVGENLQGMFYTYQVLIGDQWNEAVDPYLLQ